MEFTKPHIDEITNNNNIMTFEIEDVNVAYVNSIRRTILSDIPVCVFRTTPHKDNKVNIISNTSRFNNEIIKQRFSCIPIHISDINNTPYTNYSIELSIKNDTNDVLVVTTENFKIKDITTDTYIDQSEVKKIFPPYISPDKTEHYIDIIRLRPKISENIDGEEIDISALIDIGTAKQEGMYNVVSTCTFNNIIDTDRARDEWDKIRSEKYANIKDGDEELSNLRDNFELLDAQRFYKKDKFKFKLETLGIFSNKDIIKRTCQIIKFQLDKIKNLEKNTIEISNSDNTMNNSYDITLFNKDYTIGKLLEYEFYNNYFELEDKIINYVSFYKKHPHDTDGILRVAFIEETTLDKLKVYIQNITNIIDLKFEEIKTDILR